MTVTLTVHPKTDPTAGSIRTLTADISRAVTRVPNEPGSFRFQLPVNHADAAFLEAGHWVKVKLDGTTIMCGRIGDDAANTIDQAEESGEFVTVQAAGALATLADAEVYRPGYHGRFKTDMRWFGPMSPEFDEWIGWDPPDFYVRQDYPLSPYGTLTPTGWLVGEAGWIWPTAFDSLASPPQAVGKAHFAAVATIVEEGDRELHLTFDDGGRLFVNGVNVYERVEAFAFREFDRVRVWLDPGVNYFYGEGINMDRPSSPATNGAAFLFAMFRLVNGGEYGDLEGFSSDSWKALGYPSSPIGLTAGHIAALFLSEARFRGALLPWTWDFDEDLDSNGNPWDRRLSMGVKIGLDGLNFFRQLAAHAVDLVVDFDTFTLRMFNKGTVGSAGVTFTEGDNIRSQSFDARQPALATDAQVQTADGTFAERSSGVADTGDGDPPRIETYIQLGSADTFLDIPDQVDPVLDAFSTPKDRSLCQIVSTSGAVPFTDFDEFSPATAPNRKKTSAAATIKSVTMMEPAPDQDGEDDGTQLFAVELEQSAA